MELIGWPPVGADRAMIGTPPTQLASNAMHRPLSRATRYSSLP
jgi:hypothetical protein